MSEQDATTDKVTHSWDTYWAGAHGSAAFTRGGTSHPAVLTFWADFFATHQGRQPAPAMLDLASGNGAVLECARSAFGEQLGAVTCTDISAAAVAMLRERFPDVSALVADANNLSFADGSFDLVTSQYGIEYAGRAAFAEAARLVAPGGQLALLVHLRGGGIDRQCAASLDAVRRLQSAQFLPLCTAMFEGGFATLGGAGREAYDSAAQKLAPALKEVEQIMTQYGRDVADGTLVRLYQDVRTMHDRMQHYERSDVLDWLQRMQAEIDAYAGRMASMCDAAMDETAFQEVCAALRADGFDLIRHEPLLVPDTGVALAWALVAQRA